MKKNKYVTESFINAITKEVSILIAAMIICRPKKQKFI